MLALFLADSATRHSAPLFDGLAADSREQHKLDVATHYPRVSSRTRALRLEPMRYTNVQTGPCAIEFDPTSTPVPFFCQNATVQLN